MKISPAFLCVGLSLCTTLPAAGQSDQEQPEGAVIVRGQFSKDDPQDARSGGARKIHVIELKSGHAYKIMLNENGSARPVLRIQDEQGKVLEEITGEKAAAEVVFSPLADGKYQIVVASDKQAASDYVLSVARAEGATVVEYSGVLANTDPFDRVRQGCFHKVYLHKMFAGRAYTIDLRGQFDTYIRVESSAGVNLAEDDDGGDGLNSRLVFRPNQNDTYRVIVTSCGGNAVGQYTLRIKSDLGGAVVFSTNDQLTQQDPLDKVRQASHCKVFMVKMDAGKSYTIDLQSAQFDSYLRLESPTGNNLAEDDDGGGRLNSRISFRPPQSGLYRVVATTLGGGSTGNFSLTVRRD